MKSGLLIVLFLIIGSVYVLGEEFEITFVGTVRDVTDGLTVTVDEILASNAEHICDTVMVTGDVTGIVAGDRVHVNGYYDPDGCVVTVETAEHFLYKMPVGAELEKLGQSIQFAGEILRIYEMKGETFCDISVTEVFAVTYQERDMCQTVTVKVNPAIGEVEEGLLPGDEVEFSGTYDEKSCMCSLGWHDNYLRKERRTGISWMLIVSGIVVYLVLRKVW
jgi:hypothetical protein